VLASELITRNGNLWRGAAFNYPATLPATGSGIPEVPPLFVASGDQDHLLPTIRDRQAAFAPHSRFLIQTNSGHLNWRLDNIRQVREEAAKFFIEQAR
jgi:hypothetical protein